MLRTVRAKVAIALLLSLTLTACIDLDWGQSLRQLRQPEARRPAEKPVQRKPDRVRREPRPLTQAPTTPRRDTAPAKDAPAPDGGDPSGRDVPEQDPAPAVTPRQTDLPSVDGHTWRLVDRDDFDGSTLDRTRWEVYDNHATNGISRWLPENVRVADGELRIIGRGSNPNGHGNEAGGLCWCGRNGDQTYGMWRVRARLEPAKGYGQAFLLWPTSGRWPMEGELDFAEIPHAAKNEVVGVVHWGDPPGGRYDDARLRMDLTRWRTYTVVWRPGLVRYYVDGRLFYDSSDRPHVPVPDNAMHLALQVEPGPFGGSHWVPPPDGTSPAENVTRIDWVELYR